MIDLTRPLTLFECLYLMVTIAGFIALVVSFLLLIRQNNIQTQSRDAATNTAIAALQFQIDMIFVERPHLRKYFLERAEIWPPYPEFAQVQATAQCLLNFFEAFVLQKGTFSLLYSTSTWTAYIRDHFANSPVLCEFLRKNRSWYSNQLAAIMALEDGR